jgi:hypothetical protein
MSNLLVKHVVISSGQSLSPALGLEDGECPFMFFIPSGWDAASLTFQGTIDQVNFFNIYDISGEYQILTAGASRAVGINGVEPFMGSLGIKVRSGTYTTPVNQTADRTIYIVTKKL